MDSDGFRSNLGGSNFLGNMGYMSVKDENFPKPWSFKG